MKSAISQAATPDLPSITVVLCAYTEARWTLLERALASIRQQTLPPTEIILSIDHHRRLFQRAVEAFPDVRTIENRFAPGLSGARNSAIQTAQTEIIAFIDEDAVAAPDWLEHLCAGFETRAVIGVGGSIQPQWSAGRPGWFPQEFDWVVGCTYTGLPTQRQPIRNLIGCNMAFRKEVFSTIGTFREDVGRISTIPFGCEETELCIRTLQTWPDRILLYDPAARVEHHVPVERARFAYFVSRCYAEGLSKAQVTRLVGERDSLKSERSYVRRTLPRAVWRNLRAFFLERKLDGLGRAAAIFLGLSITSLGYAAGRLRLARRPASSPKAESSPR